MTRRQLTLLIRLMLYVGKTDNMSIIRSEEIIEQLFATISDDNPPAAQTQVPTRGMVE